MHLQGQQELTLQYSEFSVRTWCFVRLSQLGICFKAKPPHKIIRNREVLPYSFLEGRLISS